MEAVLDKLISCCVPKDNQKLVKELISNEAFHYVEPRHKTKFLELLWTVGQAAHDSQYIPLA